MRGVRWKTASAGGRRPGEIEDTPGVELRDLAGLVVGDIGQHFREHFAAVRPVAVRVRVVAFEHDVVDADEMTAGDAGPVGDKAAEYVVFIKHRRRYIAVDVVVPAVPFPHVVDALK